MNKQHVLCLLCALSLLGTPLARAEEEPPQTQIINVLEDAHVESPKPDENYGSSSALLMKQGSRHAYLKFDLSAAKPVLENPEIEIESAVLTLTVAGDNRNGTAGTERDMAINLYTLSDTWQEGSITYNNAPKFETSMLDSLVNIPAGSMIYPVDIDITGSVTELLSKENYQLSFGMQLEQSGTAAAYFFCRDSKDASYQPRLTLTYRDKIYRDAILDVEVTQDGGFVNKIAAGSLDCNLTVQNWADAESHPVLFGALYRVTDGVETMLACHTDNHLSLTANGRGMVSFSFAVPDDDGEYFLRFWAVDGIETLHLFSGETVFDKDGLHTQYPQKKGSCFIDDATVGVDRSSGKVTVATPEQTSLRQIVLLVRDGDTIAYAGVMNGGMEKSFFLSGEVVRRKYQVYLASRDAESMVTMPLDYYLDSSFTKAFAEISAAKTAGELQAAVEKYNDLLMIERDDATDENAILQWLCGQKFDSLEQFINAYQRCAAVQQLQVGKNAEEIFQQYLDTFQVDARIVTAITKDAYPVYLKDAVIQAVAAYKWSFDHACQDMQDIILASSFRAAPKYSDIQQLFEQETLFAPYYRQTLEADPYYKGLKNKSAFYKYFAQRASGLTDESSIAAAIAAASKKAHDEETSVKGSVVTGGGRGGSGSGGKASAVYEVTGAPEQPPVIQPPAADQKLSALYQDMQQAAWAGAYVRRLTEKGVLSGDGNGYFRPNDSIKREEFIKMLMAAFEMTAGGGKAPFTDVPEGNWAEPYIKAAYDNGIVTGRDDGRFGFGERLTREEMAVLCYRMIKDRSGKRFEYPQDLDMVSDYAKEAVCSLYGSGLLTGDETGAFSPRRCATRAEVCKVLCGIMEEAEK